MTDFTLCDRRHKCFPSIFLLNARSLFPKFDDLCAVLSSLQPGIVFITESWLHSNICDDIININGYDLYRCDRIGRVGGGVCAYIRSSFSCVPINSYSHPSEIEMLALRINGLHLFLICLYIPPSLKANKLNMISDFITDMLDAELAMFPHSNILICGDFNQFDTSMFSQQFSLRNCVTFPTRNASFLDQIWINPELSEFYKEDATVGPPISSCDHNSVLLVGRNGERHHGKVVKVWDFRKSYLDLFEYLLSIGLSDFTSKVSDLSVDEMCHEFYCAFYAAMSFIPYRYVTLSKSDKPWITPVLKDLINKRWNEIVKWKNKPWLLISCIKLSHKFSAFNYLVQVFIHTFVTTPERGS